MIEVTGADRDLRSAILKYIVETLDRPCSDGDMIDERQDGLYKNLAAHRQQAEDAMRRRCLSAVEEAFVILPLAPGLADGASKAFSACEAAIRGIDAGGEGE